MKEIVMLGNCHIHYISRCLEIMSDVEVHKVMPRAATGDSWIKDFLEVSENCDILGIISTYKERFHDAFPDFDKKIVYIPHLRTREYHPDAIYANSKDGPIYTLMDRNNSAIILQGYMDGLDANQIKSLFHKSIYRFLGYFDQKEKTQRWANHQSNLTHWPVDEIYDELRMDSPFVYTANHPKVGALANLAKRFAKRNNIPILYNNPEILIHDTAANGAIWPVYPELSEMWGLTGDYFFKIPEKIRKENNRNSVGISLDEFITDSLERYSVINPDEIVILGEEIRSKWSELKHSREFKSAMRRAENPNKLQQENPYSGLPDYQFWRKSISNIPLEEVDPVVSPKFNIAKSDKVATAGSCFAQHMSNALSQSGFTYFVSENPNENMSDEEIRSRNFGVYSARYGNIYTTKQLIQTVDRAYNDFKPVDDVWIREDGMLVDPFRPLIEPDGFKEKENLHASRKEHFKCIREMLENLDIFVFTLGLTEAWRSKSDKAVFPLSPGVAGGNMDETKYEFVNFEVDEIVEDLINFKEKLFNLNPEAKILLTVSPVPLIATYEDRNVLVSTTYSKSVLRVAVDKVSRNDTRIEYFPSYEIITGNFNRGNYFEDDLRSVKKEGVNHVMRLLMHHYPEKGDLDGPSMDDLVEAQIICDEEAIDS